MKRNIIGCLVIMSLLASCNPDCDQLLTVQVDANVKQSGQEILITSNNIESILGKQISFSTANKSAVAINGRYEESLGGVVYKIPEEIEGENVQILIDDPDCGLIAFDNGLSVRNAAFFDNNSSFIAPAPFEIVIPSPPISFPPLIQNAWVSPQDLDYCIWFKFLPEIVNDDTVKIMVNGLLVPKESKYLDPYASKEFSVRELVCGAASTTFYHNNPVSGIIDKDQNFVSFFIDRTNTKGQNLGIEEYEGSFLNIEQAGYKENKVPECNPNNLFDPEKVYLILAKSKRTGRQLLLYQQAFN